MNWVQIGNQMADGASLRTYAAEIEGIGCLVLASGLHQSIVFVPGVRLEGEKLVPIPPPQETFNWGAAAEAYGNQPRSNKHASPSVPSSSASISSSGSASESPSVSVSPSPEIDCDFN